ncbi:carboxymethylenebutenolidase [Enterobacterales bacterium CwR94]|nr:carboxymethylenebutenolidase [Enterobacterales bacterium CwR94]
MKTEDIQATLSTGKGYAAAVEPVAETAIQTASHTIQFGPTSIASQGENMPAFFAKPKHHEKDLPVVLVVQEIFGVHEHIEDICRRLACEGYLAVAPELYFRQGDPGEYQDIPTLLKELVNKVPDQQVLSDLDHVVNWALKHGGDKNKIGITGFCWGGRITWLFAAHNPQVKAGIAWYGKLVGERTMAQQKHPVDEVDNLSAPVLGLYGALDEGITLDSVESMRQAIRAANNASEIVVYPEAGHAFNADYRPSYHEESAKDGWQRMLAWLQKHGVTP